MLTLLLAAALTAAQPVPAPVAPVAPSDHMVEVAKALPLVCEAQFIEEVRIKAAGLDKDHTAKVIDIFAEKENLNPEVKAQVQVICAYFDLGATYIIDEINEQQKQAHHSGLRKPFDDIASFTH